MCYNEYVTTKIRHKSHFSGHYFFRIERTCAMKNYVSLLNIGITYPNPVKYLTSQNHVHRIHVPISGSVLFSRGKNTIKLVPGNAYVLPASAMDSFTLLDKEDYLHLFIDFRCAPPPISKEPKVIDLEQDKALKSILDYVITLIKNYKNKDVPGHITPHRDRTIFKQLEYAVTLILSHLWMFHDFRGIENSKIRDAIDFISQNYQRPIHNEDIAAAVGLETRTLSRLFDKHLAISPYYYLTQHRIEMAVKELHKGNSVSETATLCGFQSENTFREAFKRVMGVAPSEIGKADD